MSECTAFTKKGTKCVRKAFWDGKCKMHAEKPVYYHGGKCITITFGDTAENGVGMQKIGAKDDAFGATITPHFLKELAKKIGGEYIDLTCVTFYEKKEVEETGILIIRGWCKNGDATLKELLGLDWDKKGLFRGVVKNKTARHNLCFTDHSQEPDYEAGKGRVVSFGDLPELARNRKRVEEMLGLETVYGEGNLYYDLAKTCIGFHGDVERSFVVGLRLGDGIPLHYRWFYKTKPLSNVVSINLNHGDLYIMSHKAVGSDWKRSSIPTLRHAAGNPALIKGIN